MVSEIFSNLSDAVILKSPSQTLSPHLEHPHQLAAQCWSGEPHGDIQRARKQAFNVRVSLEMLLFSCLIITACRYRNGAKGEVRHSSLCPCMLLRIPSHKRAIFFLPDKSCEINLGNFCENHRSLPTFSC